MRVALPSCTFHFITALTPSYIFRDGLYFLYFAIAGSPLIIHKFTWLAFVYNTQLALQFSLSRLYSQKTEVSFYYFGLSLVLLTVAVVLLSTGII